MQGERIVEAAAHQPGTSAGFDLQEWALWGVGIVVTTLAGIVGFFYRAIETRNAKDIQTLIAINDRLEKEIAETKRAQAKSDVETALLRQENAVLKERIHELEQRLANYERGHGA
jgi:hypothetical protein